MPLQYDHEIVSFVESKKTVIHLEQPYQDSIACVMVLLTRTMLKSSKFRTNYTNVVSTM